MEQLFFYKPVHFFCITFLISSMFWFAAAYISLQQSMQYLLFPFILGGMAGPSITTCIMLMQEKKPQLLNDFYTRLRLDIIKISFIPMVILGMPILIVCSILISVVCGQSCDQFLMSQQIADQSLQGVNLVGLLIIFTLCCSLEEIGWRGYGIDSLRNQFNLWETSLIFATFWSLWHIPAFFIKDGYFQQELWNLGFVHVVIYFVSLYPLTILINWIYVKNNRSILIAILSHMAINISYSLFQLQLPTKIILMYLLLFVAEMIVLTNQQLFFKKQEILC